MGHPDGTCTHSRPRAAALQKSLCERHFSARGMLWLPLALLYRPTSGAFKIDKLEDFSQV